MHFFNKKRTKSFKFCSILRKIKSKIKLLNIQPFLNEIDKRYPNNYLLSLLCNHFKLDFHSKEKILESNFIKKLKSTPKITLGTQNRHWPAGLYHKKINVKVSGFYFNQVMLENKIAERVSNLVTRVMNIFGHQ